MLSEHQNLDDIDFVLTFIKFVNGYRLSQTNHWSWDNVIDIYERFGSGTLFGIIRNISGLDHENALILSDIYTELGLIENIKEDPGFYRISKNWESIIKES